MNPKWFHLECITGGLGPCPDIKQLYALLTDQQDLVRSHSDQFGGVIMATFIGIVKQAIKARLDGFQLPGPAGEAFVDAEINDFLNEQIRDDATQDHAIQGDSPIEATLRNIPWWDGFGYGNLTVWIPILGRIPKDVHHGLALLRGVVCRGMRETRERGDTAGEAQAGKLLTYVNLLALYPPRSNRRGKRYQGLGKVITARLRLPSRGDWTALWRDAATARRKSLIKGGRNATLKEDGCVINTLVQENMIGNALSRVMSRAAVAVGPQALSALIHLFRVFPYQLLFLFCTEFQMFMSIVGLGISKDQNAKDWIIVQKSLARRKTQVYLSADQPQVG